MVVLFGLVSPRSRRNRNARYTCLQRPLVQASIAFSRACTQHGARSNVVKINHHHHHHHDHRVVALVFLSKVAALCCATGKPPLPHALRRRGEKGASPTWHRQARRARAVHRRVCRRFEAGEHILRPRLEAAVASLSSHHGSRPPKAALEALCPCGEDSFSARSLATMAWVCGQCGQSNWISLWSCRRCHSHQNSWTTVSKVPAPDPRARQTYAQVAARGAAAGKGVKGKGKVPVQAAPPAAPVPRPPAAPLTPAGVLAPPL